MPFFSSLGCFFAFAFGAPAHAGPDRSGLPLLVKVSDQIAHAKSVHVRIVREEREALTGIYLADSVTEIWALPGGSFRYDRSGMWGDGVLVVNDGQTAWVDGLDGGSPAEKRAGVARFATAAEAVALLGTGRSPLVGLLLGPDPVQGLGDEGSVVEEAAEGSERVLRIKSESIGDVTFLVDRGNRVVEVRIHTDGGTTTREFIRYLDSMPVGLFRWEPSPSPNRAVRRKE